MRVTLFLVMLITFAATSACDTDSSGGGGSTTPTEPVVRTVTVPLDGGLILATGEVSTKAELRDVDLILYKAGTSAQLKAGAIDGINHSPLHRFLLGGKDESFGALAEVPDDLPTEDDANAYIPTPGQGVGFTVVHTQSDGVSKGFVTAVEESNGTLASVTIQYVTLQTD